MKVLLSIKPEFVKKIFDGSKKYEYRKVIFKNPNVESVVVYATKPLGKVVGEFSIEKIIYDTPKSIWNLTSEYSGIAADYFQEYFKGRKKGFAIQIHETKKYSTWKDIEELNIEQAPQSFRYLTKG